MEHIDFAVLNTKILRSEYGYPSYSNVLSYWNIDRESYNRIIEHLNRIYNENPIVECKQSTVPFILFLLSWCIALVSTIFLCNGYSDVSGTMYTTAVVIVVLSISLYGALPDMRKMSLDRRTMITNSFLDKENRILRTKGVKLIADGDASVTLRLQTSQMIPIGTEEKY